MSNAPTIVYKISARGPWQAAVERGTHPGSPDDLRDGFIHFSTAAQAPDTAAKFFAGLHDLVIAAIDVNALGPALRWEPSRGGALFPHLYAPLAMSAVLWTRPLPLGDDGRHVFPAGMT